jgi:hypothetical protein
MIRLLTAALVGGAIAAPASALAAWEEVIGGASPVNVLSAQVAEEPSLASVAGVPYVAWRETSGVTGQIWVARLNAAGTAWERIGGTSPLNIDDTKSAGSPDIADIGGVPWVAWQESDGSNAEARVARLDVSGTWQQVGSGPSPINVNSTNGFAISPVIAAVGGVPYVAWGENVIADFTGRVARWNATTLAWDGVGGPLGVLTTTEVFAPTLADVLGVPHVAWAETNGVNTEIRAARLSGGAWVEMESGASPINHDTNRNAGSPALANIAGVPHIAWVETDVVNQQVRVSRLNAAGTDWAEIVGGASPINRDSGQNANVPSLIGVGSTPYVAWTEGDGTNLEVRVARLNATATAWEEIAPGPTPINASATQDAFSAAAAAVGGVPWLAWSEVDAAGRQVRVARLEPEFGPPGAVATVNGTVGASLLAPVTTYGLPYQVGFSVTGPGGGDTGLAPTSGDLALLQRDVSGLTPLTAYTYRPFATAGVSLPRVLGPVGAFTTPPAKAAVPTPTPTTDRLVATWVDRLLRTKAGTRIRLRYVSTRAGRATLELRRGTRLVRRFVATPRAGLNAFTILAPRAGSYRLILTVTTPDAKTTKATTRLIVRKK